MKRNIRSKISSIAIISVFLALLIISSKFSFNIGLIPITFQTLMVLLISLILNRNQSIILFFIYILIGLLGMPVFTLGGGIIYVFKPSFGFILGFLLQSVIFSKKTRIKPMIECIIRLALIYFAGIIYMYIILNYYLDIKTSWISVIRIGIVPFIIKDFISAFISVFIFKRIKTINVLETILENVY